MGCVKVATLKWAHYGITYSNSYFFNKVLAWRGLLVEVSPSSFMSLTKNRPNELALVHAAVCNNDDQSNSDNNQVHFYEEPNGKGPWVAGIWEFTTESFRQK